MQNRGSGMRERMLLIRQVTQITCYIFWAADDRGQRTRIGFNGISHRACGTWTSLRRCWRPTCPTHIVVPNPQPVTPIPSPTENRLVKNRWKGRGGWEHSASRIEASSSLRVFLVAKLFASASACLPAFTTACHLRSSPTSVFVTLSLSLWNLCLSS